MNWMKLITIGTNGSSIWILKELEEAGQVFYDGEETEVIITPFEKVCELFNIPADDEYFRATYVDETGTVFLVVYCDSMYIVSAKDVIQWIVSMVSQVAL